MAVSPTLEGAGPAVKEIRAVRNACAVIEAVAAHQPVGVSELSRITGIDKSAVQRIAVTLHAAGWLHPHPVAPTRWEISPGNPVLRHVATQSLAARARPAMERLRDRSGETVILVTRDEGRLVAAGIAESRQLVRLSPPVGLVLPLEGSAAAAAIVAHLPPEELRRLRPVLPSLGRYSPETIRRRGWAANDREVTDEVRAVAAAVLAADGYPVGALVVCGPSSRVGRDDLPRLGAMAAEAARQVFTEEPAAPP